MRLTLELRNAPMQGVEAEGEAGEVGRAPLRFDVKCY